MATPIFDLPLTQRMDNGTDAKTVYVGKAAPGTAESAAKWQIFKIFYDVAGAVSAIEFANFDPRFVHVWASRASYTYELGPMI